MEIQLDQQNLDPASHSNWGKLYREWAPSDHVFLSREKSRRWIRQLLGKLKWKRDDGTARRDMAGRELSKRLWCAACSQNHITACFDRLPALARNLHKHVVQEARDVLNHVVQVARDLLNHVVQEARDLHKHVEQEVKESSVGNENLGRGGIQYERSLAWMKFCFWINVVRNAQRHC